MNLGDPSIPIIGQSATAIPTQMRLEASNVVGKQLEQCKRLGLRFGRYGVPCPINATSAQMMVLLEAFEQAGCRIVALTEHPATQDVLMVFITFRAPESLFQQPSPLA